MYKVYPFQYQGARELYQLERGLLADGMGMFKTSQSIFADSLVRRDIGNTRTLVVTQNAVREHWDREIQRWAPHYNPRVQILDARSFEEGIERAKDSDWTIISYPLMSALGGSDINAQRRSRQLMDLEYGHVILDEVHNAKNPSALRARPIKTISDRTRYVSLLSGTPIPNTITDLYMLMSYLEPSTYPVNFDDPQEMGRLLSRFYSMYKRDSQMVKRLFRERMTRREPQDYIAEKVPKAEEHEVLIDLEGDHAAIYAAVRAQQSSFGKKIMQMEKAALDPALVDPDFIDDPKIRDMLHRTDSLKYRALDGIVESETGNGGKVLIFTNLKTGVTKKLQDRYSRYGAVVIDGDVDYESVHGADSERELIRKRFQNESDIRVMIASDTMNEGADITAATAVVNLGIPWTPAELRQRIARSQRYGEVQKDSLRAYNLITRVHDGPSLEEATMEAIKQKERVIKFMLSGVELTRADFEIMHDTKKIKSVRDAIGPTNGTKLKEDDEEV